jgi:two-component sensor histidine kinase
MSSAQFSPQESSIAAVRRFVVDQLRASIRSDDVVLVASELATNVVRHAKTDFAVEIDRDEIIRLQVSDGSSIVPAVGDLVHRSDGLGLRMVQAVADRWGVEATGDGKVIWAEFADSEDSHLDEIAPPAW